MRADIIDWFAKEGEIYDDEMEDYIRAEIEETMDAGLEDGSVEEVSKYFNIMFRECAVGNYASVERAVANATQSGNNTSASVCHEQCEGCEGCDHSDDEDMDESEVPPALESAFPHEYLNECFRRITATLTATTPPPSDPAALLSALHVATTDLLKAENVPVPQTAPPKKKKKSGKNTIETGDDGWSTVK
eukprot:TRINITY_DN3794_c3_g1_i2.p1 TRINITY_DN3794_c3_g1~~TRINITY_DN3794_c3_g1_i2.p1  ORF type:complete len:190 (+),score=49.59 TRINITY_DN3794_c3_g1_i2:143-712(+)